MADRRVLDAGLLERRRGRRRSPPAIDASRRVAEEDRAARVGREGARAGAARGDRVAPSRSTTLTGMPSAPLQVAAAVPTTSPRRCRRERHDVAALGHAGRSSGQG